MHAPRWSWLLAATCRLAPLTLAQTISVNNKAVAADETNVAPASESVSIQNALPEESLQLTDEVLTNLTDLGLSNIDLFYFQDAASQEKRGLSDLFECKLLPGDKLFPGEKVWKVLDLLTGGALIKTVPLGAACYKGEHYDAGKCQFLLDNWSNSTTHINDPTSVMSPLYQGATCEPQNAAKGGKCELGGFPLYSVKISNVAQIQLALNFARNLNLRLVVHNTGHDFLGKSTGAGALSLWTHNMKSVKHLPKYRSAGGYRGPALRLGAGIEVRDLYEAADRLGYTAVGGECRDVGVTGGYLAGGGHSPLSPIAGLGSDQVLSVDIVTPDGRFITADEKQNKDLFWAIRGGGPATWGVVTSMTVKVYPKMGFSGMTWSVDTASANISEAKLWKAVEMYWRRFPEYSAKNSYGYGFIFPAGEGSHLWTMNPWMVPGMALSDFKKMVAPLLEDWAAIGVNVQPKFFEYDRFYPAWRNHFPAENSGNPYVRTGSRLIPRKNWEDEALLNKTIDTLLDIGKSGGTLIIYNINAEAPDGTPSSAANPAWRDANMFVITALQWDAETSPLDVLDINDRLTNGVMETLKAVTPGGGGYGNEGDVMDADFGQSFFGSNYADLYKLKQKIDPHGVFYAPTAVGSEDWYVTGQAEVLLMQTGRLCRKQI